MKNSNYSVIIPCFNGSKFIVETLESVVAQTLPPLEIIVIDDGSTDDSAAKAESFGSPVRVIRQRNQGESVARNRGIAEAKGEWIAFLDADDRWEPQKLEKQLGLAQQTDAICVFTAFYWFGAEEGFPEGNANSTQLCLETLIRTPIIQPSTAIVARKVCPNFPEWTRHGEDMIFFASLAERGSFCFVNERLVGYRKHASNQSSSPSHCIQNCASRIQWLVDNKSQFGDAEVTRISKLIIADLAELGSLAKYRRDWIRYWTIRDYLATHEIGRREPICSEYVWPKFVYRLRDLIGS